MGTVIPLYWFITVCRSPWSIAKVIETDISSDGVVSDPMWYDVFHYLVYIIKLAKLGYDVGKVAELGQSSLCHSLPTIMTHTS